MGVLRGDCAVCWLFVLCLGSFVGYFNSVVYVDICSGVSLLISCACE